MYAFKWVEVGTSKVCLLPLSLEHNNLTCPFGVRSGVAINLPRLCLIGGQTSRHWLGECKRTAAYSVTT